MVPMPSPAAVRTSSLGWSLAQAALLTGSLMAGSPTAQEPTPPSVPPTPPQTESKPQVVERPHFVVRRYPEDKDKAVAVVGSRTLTLDDLVQHIDRRHYPGFAQALATRPEIQRMLTSDLIAPWVRQFADAEALRQTYADRIDEEKLEQEQSKTLKEGFERWLADYNENRRQSGFTTELTQQRVNSLLADYQLRRGLAVEVDGLLAHLVPDDATRPQLHTFFNANPRYFGGQVTIAHILVQHRDGGTGILLDDEGLARANARLADIKARLRPDGSNFEEVARQFSDDTRTARDGGLLGPLHRFDDRMPAALCRAAWSIRDGEVCPDVVETPYGWHLVKRIDFNQLVFILFTDDAIPSIRIVHRRAEQERLLFEARERTGLRLML
jgi:hypothetical protein